MILAPVQRPGAGRGGGVYERAGLIDVRNETQDEWTQDARIQDARRQFENFEWVDSVVTII